MQRWNNAVKPFRKATHTAAHYRHNHMKIVGGTFASLNNSHQSETACRHKFIPSADIPRQWLPGDVPDCGLHVLDLARMAV